MRVFVLKIGLQDFRDHVPYEYLGSSLSLPPKMIRQRAYPENEAKEGTVFRVMATPSGGGPSPKSSQHPKREVALLAPL